jgi:uncharacterized protein (DUF427 family)
MHTIRILDRHNGETIAEGIFGEQVIDLENSWYFAPQYVDMTKLRISERTYTCPYKGVCFWIDLENDGVYAQNVGWVYHTPKRGFEHIAGLIGFGKADTFATGVEVMETA